jgi:hypothetical protein
MSFTSSAWISCVRCEGKGLKTKLFCSAGSLNASGQKTVAFRSQDRKYELCHIYNMNEIGFAVGDTQSTRVMVDSTQKSNWKVTAGKQEWVTVLEYIDGTGS